MSPAAMLGALTLHSQPYAKVDSRRPNSFQGKTPGPLEKHDKQHGLVFVLDENRENNGCLN